MGSNRMKPANINDAFFKGQDALAEGVEMEGLSFNSFKYMIKCMVCDIRLDWTLQQSLRSTYLQAAK